MSSGVRRTLALLAGVLATIPAAPASAQDVEFGAQVRPRYEYRDPGDALTGGSQIFISMRTRASVRARLDKGVGLFVQLQDVRLWGEETSTLGDFDADHFDLHQGYLQVTSESGDYRARAGRQEAVFGGQRLVGAVNWTQQGRSFDGVRLTFRHGWGDLDLVGFRIAETDAPDITVDHDFVGGYAVIGDVLAGDLDLYALYDRARGVGELDRTTLGFRLHGDAAPVRYRFESSYQLGDQDGLDISAFMFGARVGTAFADGRATATLWYDYLSGDDDATDAEMGVFNTLYATNHKFYGYADLFLNIPVHTAGLGLQDLALKASFDVRDDLTLRADLHSFRLAEETAAGDTHLGEEIDLTGVYRYSDALTLQTGLSYVLQDDALADIGRLSEDLTFFYVMLNASF